MVITITLGIYVRSGGTIYRKRQQLLKAQGSGSGSGGLSYANQSSTNYVKTTEVTIVGESIHQSEAVQLQNLGHQASVRVHKPTIDREDTRASVAANPQPNNPKPSVRPSNDVYKAAWAYTKVAMLFFVVILTTWIPSSANRMYSHIHPDQVSKPL